MTLKYIWRSFSLGCHFHVHFSYPWHAFASHGLPAIAELLVYRAIYYSAKRGLAIACPFVCPFVCDVGGLWSQCESKNPKFSDIFFSNGWEFLVQIFRGYYTFLSTLDYKFLFSYLATLTKLCHIKRDHHNVLKMSTIDRNARWVVALNMA